MALAAVVDDRSWFYADVYERRGQTLVKVGKVGPFLGTAEAAASAFRDISRQNLGRELVKKRWSKALMRWEAYP